MEAATPYPSTTSLLKEPVWAPEAYPDDGSQAERIAASYARAKTVARHVQMSVEDVTKLTAKFWAFHKDFIVTADSAVVTILTIHWNLCMGTIALWPHQHPALKAILSELEEFESVGEFMLTEVGHGLDARNIETTATLHSDGSFDLHTPTPRAAKIMPPTTPLAGMGRFAVVFAQLIVAGECRGVRPFVVRINTSDAAMAPGIVSRLLPARPGAKPVDHAITAFHHVRVEAWAILGSVDTPDNVRKDFFRHIHRVTVGTLSLTMTHIPALRLSAYILGRYSQRRMVAGRGAKGAPESIPIINFSTQHTPVITALTFASVFDAFASDLCRTFAAIEPRVRSGLACVFKQTASSASDTLYSEMIDRCGWQGLYTHNQIIELAMALRGNSIAEGDKLVLCIRLVSELLLKRYQLPPARDSKSLLARHETSVWKDVSALTKKIMIAPDSNRNEAFNNLVLPRCRSLVSAVGHRMAYDAAAESSVVTPEMLDLFEATCMLEDAGWYVEHKKLSMSALQRRHAKAVSALLPKLNSMLEQTLAEPWSTAPILKDEAWNNFIRGLPPFPETDNGDIITPSGCDTPVSDVTVRVESNMMEKIQVAMIEERSAESEAHDQKAGKSSMFGRVGSRSRRKWSWLLKIP